MNPDMEKARRENLRWLVLVALNSAQPVGAGEQVLFTAITAIVPDLTQLELRRALDYLAEAALLSISGKGKQPQWFCKLERLGIDTVEYTVECAPGIARPTKYW